jgi:hypothetical protein
LRALGFAAALAVLPAAAVAQGQVEFSVGGGVGSNYIRRGPFVFDGFSYADGYRICTPGVDAQRCVLAGATDVATALESNYPVLVVAGLEARRGIGGPFLLGAGVLGGVSLRNQRVVLGDSGEVVEGRPLFTQDVGNAADSNATFGTNGVGALAYLHGGLRWDRGFESRTTIGYRPSGTRVFAEAGAGWLAAVPGGGDAGVGHPLGIHAVAGITVRRANARSLTFSLRHVRAVGVNDDLLVSSRLNWTVFQIGWLSDR